MTFLQWRTFAQRVNGIAERISRMKIDRGFALARANGISPDMCCIHNASIDENLTGWCHNNPARLKAAKRAKRIVDDCRHNRLAESVIARAYATVKHSR